MIKKYFFSISFTLAILILIILELLTLFILGPIRFFQDMKNMEELAYFLTKYLPYFRIILLGIIIWTAFHIFKKPKKYPKILVGITLLIYFGIFYMSNFQLKAGKLFYDQNVSIYEPVSTNNIPLDKDVIGVSSNGESKAYSLDILAYHHKILDSVGNEPVLVTYCIWCRSGRVFSPVIDGQLETFKLVGITEYNAIIKDKSSATWWRQATGEAIAGKKKGAKMDEIYSEQMTLNSWIEKYPNTLVLQRDSSFVEEYDHNSKFVSRFGVEKRGADYDCSWEERSWVIGVTNGNTSTAFDYHYLIQHRIMQDSVGDLPVLVVLEPDSISFHSWDTRVNGTALIFEYNPDSNNLVEAQTETVWDMSGRCISGPLEGERLKAVQSYEEYWHSWVSFHPNTKKAGYDFE